ncbi:hypothetical protein HDU97_002732 [Phlyctochytrium planicorne]|nr:hypothetical protein HDU97_002732 [Phlyctochytrium planicorne]
MSALFTSITSILHSPPHLLATLPLDLSDAEKTWKVLEEHVIATGSEWTEDEKSLLTELLALAVRAEAGGLGAITALVKILDSDPRLNSVRDVKESQETLSKASVSLLLKASKLDHGDSQIDLANRIISGSHGWSKDDYEAVGWLVSSARTAQTQLTPTTLLTTLLLTSPQLPPPDLSDIMDILIHGCRDSFYPAGERASVEVWEKYALEIPGDGNCLHELAGIYASGEGGVTESPTIALHYYLQSALKGSWKGFQSLADLHPSTPFSLTITVDDIPAHLRQISFRLQALPATTPLLLTETIASIVASAGLPDPDTAAPISKTRLESLKPKNAATAATGSVGDVESVKKAVVSFFEATSEEVRQDAKKEIVKALDIRKAAWAEARAKEGDLDAIVEYAKTLSDSVQKKSWLQRAADAGSALAFYSLYEQAGDSDPSGTDYLNKAAEKKWPDACYRRGLQCEKGTFWEDKNLAKAQEYYEQAGPFHGPSQYRLALLLSSQQNPTSETQSLIQKSTRTSLLNGSLQSSLLHGTRLYNEGKSAGGPWIERAKDRLAQTDDWIESVLEGQAGEVKAALKGMEIECRRWMRSEKGKDLVAKGREGDGEAQMGVARLLKAIGYPGIATTIFLGNLERPLVQIDARFELARAFHFGIGDIHRNLLKAVCWYYASALSGFKLLFTVTSDPSSPNSIAAKGGRTGRAPVSTSSTWLTSATLACLALADLYETGAEDILARAPRTKNENLSLAGASSFLTSPTSAPPITSPTKDASATASTTLSETAHFHAIPVDTLLSSQYRSASTYLLAYLETRTLPTPFTPSTLSTLLPSPKLPIDLATFLQKESQNATIRQHGASGILRIGDVDELMKEVDEGLMFLPTVGQEPPKKKEEAAAVAPPPPSVEATAAAVKGASAADVVAAAPHPPAAAAAAEGPGTDGKKKKPAGREPGSAETEADVNPLAAAESEAANLATAAAMPTPPFPPPTATQTPSYILGENTVRDVLYLSVGVAAIAFDVGVENVSCVVNDCRSKVKALSDWSRRLINLSSL